jgi:hypothetical protein
MACRRKAAKLEMHEYLATEAHSRRTTRLAMAASSHVVRSASVAANGDHS